MVSRLLGGDVIGGEMVWWQDDHNMLSLTDYGHLTTKPSHQQQNCHQEVDFPYETGSAVQRHKIASK